MSFACAYRVREYGRLFWSPRLDEFRGQNPANSVFGRRQTDLAKAPLLRSEVRNQNFRQNISHAIAVLRNVVENRLDCLCVVNVRIPAD